MKSGFKPDIHNEEDYIANGTLVSFTDSSLTLRSELTKKDNTILFENIGQVRVRQSSEDRGSGRLFAGYGVLEIILAPFAGIWQHAPYDWTSALAIFGFGVIMTTKGYLILSPYDKSYTVSGTYQSR